MVCPLGLPETIYVRLRVVRWLLNTASVDFRQAPSFSSCPHLLSTSQISVKLGLLRRISGNGHVNAISFANGYSEVFGWRYLPGRHFRLLANNTLPVGLETYFLQLFDCMQLWIDLVALECPT